MESPSAAPWTEHPNVDLLKRACIAARKGDRTVAEELFPQVDNLYIMGDNLLAGLYEGRERSSNSTRRPGS